MLLTYLLVKRLIIIYVNNYSILTSYDLYYNNYIINCNYNYIAINEMAKTIDQKKTKLSLLHSVL